MSSVGEKLSIWKSSRVLVTGGAGFIGSALVWELNQRGGCDIVVVDSRSSEAKHRNLSGLRFSCYLDSGALLEQLRSGSLGKFDFVLHMGACSSTLEKNEEYLRRNNYEYTRDLADWALNSNVRFAYASSAATYGDGSSGMDDTDPHNLERLQPLNPYGLSKHWMDLHAWRQGWLEHIVGLKYFNVFGPNEGHKGEMRSVVHKSVGQVMEKGHIRLFKSYRREYDDGEQKRDFLYVKDAVNMTLFLAENRRANGIFNIGSGVAHSWNELASAIFAALDRQPRIEYIEMPEAIRSKYQYFTQAEIGKLRSAGYDRQIAPLAESVRDYVLNYLVPARSLGEVASTY
jgi:ADP-L-glycero-D-manno-heptose 6-epimerase